MNKNQLPYLVSLVDDDLSEVRDEVLKELTNYGSALEEDLKDFSDILEPNKIDLIYPIIESSRRTWLREKWIKWQSIEDEYTRLEVALGLIARFQYGLTYNIKLSDKLNELSEKFIQFHPHGNEVTLAHFLFNGENITGEKQDFYNPLNSNILNVLIEKKGLPITLAAVYMLVGKRLGFNIEGCNFPGHFLTRVRKDDNVFFVDCFNKGKIIYDDQIKEVLKDSYESLFNYLHVVPTTNTIIKRVVQNLITAYKETNDQLNRFLFSDLFESTPSD